jgi:hypothetical protein
LIGVVDEFTGSGNKVNSFKMLEVARNKYHQLIVERNAASGSPVLEKK